jgi:actin related protein 2/3 complex subunit 5
MCVIVTTTPNSAGVITPSFVMADDGELLSALATRESSVDGLLRSKRMADALQTSLSDPPVASKSADVKKKYAMLVLKVIAAVDDKQIDDVLSPLDLDTCDILMKYVYKGLESPDQSTQLLKWHAKLLDKVGLGAVVRVMADRKTV